MDVKLKPFDFAQAASRAGMPEVAERVRQSARAAGLSSGSTGAAEAAERGGFQVALTNALRSVSNAQNESTTLQREVSLDNPTVSIEQTMVAMQKAQIGFQAALTVRNKLVQAYSDIMNMNV